MCDNLDFEKKNILKRRITKKKEKRDNLDGNKKTVEKEDSKREKRKA